MNSFKLIFENCWRDLREGDGRISMATQTALLFFLLTLTLTSASIQRYLADNLDQMLGSDVVVETHAPIKDADEIALRSLAQHMSVTQLSDITLTHKDAWARVKLKLVDDAYPLQGNLQIGATPAATQRPVEQGPQIGEIWLDSRLATQLQTSVGDVLTIGSIRLRLSAILFHEPDRLMEGHSSAMRAMAHINSFAGASIGGNTRIRYLATANDSQQDAIQAWAEAKLPGTSVIKKNGGEHPLASFWQRTENFLGLASVILFFMGAVALDMTNRRWLAKMRYRLAIYASFGTRTRMGMLMALGEWLVGFVLSALLATVLAALAYGLIVTQMQVYFPGLQPSWHWLSAFKTIGLVFLLLLALQVPSFVQLSRASLLSLIRNPAENSHVWQRLFWSFTAVTLLAAAYSDNWLLTGMTLAAIAVALALMLVLTWIVIRLGDFWGRRRSGLLPFAFFMMRQRLFAKSAQVLGLGLCGLLLLFSLMLMRDLGATLESNSRAHDGNLMISDARSDQIDGIRRWTAETGSSIRILRPFVPAQLVAINGESLSDHVQNPSDTLATLKDPIRLSWTNALPRNNQLVGGQWWPDGTDQWQQVSAEAEVMTDLGLSYGDILTYQVNGKAYDFKLVASHDFQPGHGSITFWFQIPLSARAQIDADTHYMGSMELPEPAWKALAGLWQQYPTLSLVPLRELTERFDQTLGIVTRLTSGYAAMVLLLALFVLAASVSGFSADDRQKNGLLMSMGLRNADCLKLNFYDWGVTALIAASGAVAGTWIAGFLIYQGQFNLTYNPDARWVAGMACTMVAVVCLIGYLACRQSLRVSVRDLLTT